MTNFLLNKVTYDESYVASSMLTNGWFDAKNLDSEQLTGLLSRSHREFVGHRITKEVTHNEEVWLQPWRRYTFLVNINHGIKGFNIL